MVPFPELNRIWRHDRCMSIIMIPQNPGLSHIASRVKSKGVPRSRAIKGSCNGCRVIGFLVKADPGSPGGRGHFRQISYRHVPYTEGDCIVGFPIHPLAVCNRNTNKCAIVAVS